LAVVEETECRQVEAHNEAEIDRALLAGAASLESTTRLAIRGDTETTERLAVASTLVCASPSPALRHGKMWNEWSLRHGCAVGSHFMRQIDRPSSS
jgi:hypothetical protein